MSEKKVSALRPVASEASKGRAKGENLNVQKLQEARLKVRKPHPTGAEGGTSLRVKDALPPQASGKQEAAGPARRAWKYGAPPKLDAASLHSVTTGLEAGKGAILKVLYESTRFAEVLAEPESFEEFGRRRHRVLGNVERLAEGAGAAASSASMLMRSSAWQDMRSVDAAKYDAWLTGVKSALLDTGIRRLTSETRKRFEDDGVLSLLEQNELRLLAHEWNVGSAELHKIFEKVSAERTSWSVESHAALEELRPAGDDFPTIHNIGDLLRLADLDVEKVLHDVRSALERRSMAIWLQTLGDPIPELRQLCVNIAQAVVDARKRGADSATINALLATTAWRVLWTAGFRGLQLSDGTIAKSPGKIVSAAEESSGLVEPLRRPAFEGVLEGWLQHWHSDRTDAIHAAQELRSSMPSVDAATPHVVTLLHRVYWGLGGTAAEFGAAPRSDGTAWRFGEPQQVLDVPIEERSFAVEPHLVDWLEKVQGASAARQAFESVMPVDATGETRRNLMGWLLGEFQLRIGTLEIERFSLEEVATKMVSRRQQEALGGEVRRGVLAWWLFMQAGTSELTRELIPLLGSEKSDSVLAHVFAWTAGLPKELWLNSSGDLCEKVPGPVELSENAERFALALAEEEIGELIAEYLGDDSAVALRTAGNPVERLAALGDTRLRNLDLSLVCLGGDAGEEHAGAVTSVDSLLDSLSPMEIPQSFIDACNSGAMDLWLRSLGRSASADAATRDCRSVRSELGRAYVYLWELGYPWLVVGEELVKSPAELIALGRTHAEAIADLLDCGLLELWVPTEHRDALRKLRVLSAKDADAAEQAATLRLARWTDRASLALRILGAKPDTLRPDSGVEIACPTGSNVHGLWPARNRWVDEGDVPVTYWAHSSLSPEAQVTVLPTLSSAMGSGVPVEVELKTGKAVVSLDWCSVSHKDLELATEWGRATIASPLGPALLMNSIRSAGPFALLFLFGLWGPILGKMMLGGFFVGMWPLVLLLAFALGGGDAGDSSESEFEFVEHVGRRTRVQRVAFWLLLTFLLGVLIDLAFSGGGWVGVTSLAVSTALAVAGVFGAWARSWSKLSYRGFAILTAALGVVIAITPFLVSVSASSALTTTLESALLEGSADE